MGTPTENDNSTEVPAPAKTGGYEDPREEQELRADLEETWQSESPATAQETETADEVDGRIGTRGRSSEDGAHG